MIALKPVMLLAAVLALTAANPVTLLVSARMVLLVEEIPLHLLVAVGEIDPIKLPDSVVAMAEEIEAMEVRVVALFLATVVESMVILRRTALNRNLLATTAGNQDTLFVIALSLVLSVQLLFRNVTRVEDLAISLVIARALLHPLVTSVINLDILRVIARSNFFHPSPASEYLGILSCTLLIFSPTKTLISVLGQ